MTSALAFAADDSNVNPGLLGFVVVAALGVATWLLVRSMSRQLRKIDIPDDDHGDDDAPHGDDDAPDGTGAPSVIGEPHDATGRGGVEPGSGAGPPRD